MTNETRIGFDAASEAILSGDAVACKLWVLLSNEHERDNYWLKPDPWEGPGNYQRVRYMDGRNHLVRVPIESFVLPTTRVEGQP